MTFKTIKNIIDTYSYSLIDIINELADTLIQKLINNDTDKYKNMFILSQLRNININILDSGCSDIQLYNIVSIFITTSTSRNFT